MSKAIQEKVLIVRNLTRQFGEGCEKCRSNPGTLERNYCPHCQTIYATREVSFDLYRGEILGIVGESGSGKSTLVRTLYFDQEATEGEAFLMDFEEGRENILKVSSQQKRYLRDYLLGMVYQNPFLGLKMKFSALSNVAEKLIAAGGRHVGTMTDRAHELLDVVTIEDYRRKDAPENFSGGMQQRVQIAKALSNNPPVLFLDEVTTGLDLSVQANVLDLIKEIQRNLGISMVIVSHDLGVIRMLADRTLVMLDGRVIEAGLTDQILEDPQHPYTQKLVQSLL
ncbi:MAG: phosphonate C-P lyase system protein PhnK [delta proteobacterium ML8_F1]|nr:MAG: phosphonate C-P lyase system protein PhnK [delta proteobacterium ML8_F1]